MWTSDWGEAAGDGEGDGEGEIVGVGEGVGTMITDGADCNPRAEAVISAVPAAIAFASPFESTVAMSVLFDRQAKITLLNSFSVWSNAVPTNCNC